MIDTALQLTKSTYGPYRIDYSEELLSAARKQELLLSGTRINIDRLVGFPPKSGLRTAFLLVNYPLLRGFMSYRIPLIRRDSQEHFNSVTSLDDLRKIPLGLGKNWEGYIYQKNGFNLTEPINMTLLLKMLAGKRFDFVPLSAIEIEDHYQIDGRIVDTLVPEEHLLLYLPLPTYFYVSPQTPILAERLRVGFQKMEINGSSRRIFDKYFAARLNNLHIAKRTLIEIPNPENDGSVEVVSHKEIENYQ